jgi:hypothetical protein
VVRDSLKGCYGMWKLQIAHFLFDIMVEKRHRTNTSKRDPLKLFTGCRDDVDFPGFFVVELGFLGR